MPARPSEPERREQHERHRAVGAAPRGSRRASRRRPCSGIMQSSSATSKRSPPSAARAPRAELGASVAIMPHARHLRGRCAGSSRCRRRSARAARRARPAARRRPAPASSVRRRVGHDRDVKRAALAGPGSLSPPIVAAHQLGQPLADREPEPGAAVAARGRGVDLAERLEQALACRRRRCRCRCRAPRRRSHTTEPAARRLALRRDRQHDLAALGELDRVDEQVEQDLPQRVRRRRRSAPGTPSSIT